jgi:hypothetical protein
MGPAGRRGIVAPRLTSGLLLAALALVPLMSNAQQAPVWCPGVVEAHPTDWWGASPCRNVPAVRLHTAPAQLHATLLLLGHVHGELQLCAQLLHMFQ